MCNSLRNLFCLVALMACACPAVNVVDDAGSADVLRVDAGSIPDAEALDASTSDAEVNDVVVDAPTPDAGEPDAGEPLVDAGQADVDGPPSSALVVMTFNTGTTDGLAHNSDGDLYGDAQVEISDQYYGNGLSWLDAIDAATRFFAEQAPDIVAFQEIFHPADCAQIPAEQRAGFVCASWNTGDPSVAQSILGSAYQVACNLGKPDKCLGIKRSFAQIRGCDDDLCLDELEGAPVPNCGGGSRIGRATLDLRAGGEITVVTVHGTSGTSDDDINCREAQIEQVFTNLDGEPGVNGARNIVLGDFNADPAWEFFDNSADRWTDYVGGNNAFQFLTDYGFGSEPTYGGVANIDHIASDTFIGNCVAHGVTPGFPAVNPNVYFDHVPVSCTVQAP